MRFQVQKLLLIAACVASCGFGAAQKAQKEEALRERAKARVNGMLGNYKGDNKANQHLAMCWWVVGTPTCQELVMGSFQGWLNEMDIKTIDSYEIGAIETDMSATPPRAIVTVVIDGYEMKIEVRDGWKMAWAE